MLASLGSADISDYKILRFAAKGNGKTYDVKMMRSAVRDYAQFRVSFTAPKEWTTIEVKLDDMKQPDWGHKLGKVWVDVEREYSSHPPPRSTTRISISASTTSSS